jgi:hypothetical protein
MVRFKVKLPVVGSGINVMVVTGLNCRYDVEESATHSGLVKGSADNPA